MKKILCFMLLFIFPGLVYASSANIKISAPSSVYVGDTVKVSVTISSSNSLGSWQYSVAYDGAKLGDSSESQMVASYADNSGKKSVTNTWTFKAKSEGSVTFSIPSIVVYAFDDDSEMSLSGSKSATINIKKPNAVSGGGSNGGGGNNSKPSIDYKYSDNNNLSSLVIEGHEFEFDKNKTDYNLTVPNDTTSVKVGATAEDGKARVSGIGDFEVKEGDNLIEVVVTAENGDKKTYKLNVVVEEATPIEVKVDDDIYSVVRKADLLPDAIAIYKESTTLIKGEEVPCYYNEIADFYLVGLRDNEGNVELYRYDAKEDKFYVYNQLQIGGIYIALLDGDTPNGYKLGTVKIGEKEYSAFIKDDAYPLLYGINLESGEKNYYSYDENEGTIQKLLKSAGTSIFSEKSSLIIYGLIGLCIFEFIVLIVSVSSKNKKLKKALRSKLDTKTEYEKSLSNDVEESDEAAADLKNNFTEEEPTQEDIDTIEKEVDHIADERYGYTAYVSDSVSNVFNSSKKEKKISKKKKKNDDDEMFQF